MNVKTLDTGCQSILARTASPTGMLAFYLISWQLTLQSEICFLDCVLLVISAY